MIKLDWRGKVDDERVDDLLKRLSLVKIDARKLLGEAEEQLAATETNRDKAWTDMMVLEDKGEDNTPRYRSLSVYYDTLTDERRSLENLIEILEMIAEED